jgi:ribonuclease P protein component
MRKSLTRSERLSGKRDITAIFREAARLEGKGVRLLYRPNGLSFNRILVTVRRGFSTAVARNRQKRIIREIYRNSKRGLKPGFDLAFVIMKEDTSFDDLRATVARLFGKAGLVAGAETEYNSGRDFP